MHMSVPPAVL
uniref:Uncharacterized protein n=1 Tax=Anguilla anguilla TaxID=7936 RepID=A0A0E9V3W6_ANGAN